MTRTEQRRMLTAGAYAAGVISILFVTVILLFAAVGPRLGIHTHEDTLDADKMLPIIRDWPAVVCVYLLGALFSACVLVLAFATSALLWDAAPHRAAMATALAMIHIALTLSADLPRLIVLPHLARLYAHEPEVASGAFLSCSLVLVGLNVAARIVFGAWLILICWTGWTTKKLRSALCATGIAVSSLHIACLFVPFPPVADVLWFPFLAAALRRAHRTGRA